MSLVGKHIFRNHRFLSSYDKVEVVYRRLYLINRETRTQLISNAQRIVLDYSTDPVMFTFDKRIAHRIKKNKLFTDNGEFSNKYGEMSLANKENVECMMSDVPFENMFYISKTKKDIFSLFKSRKDKTIFPCYDLDKVTDEMTFMTMLESIKSAAAHLEKLFGLKAYYVDRMQEIDDVDSERLSNYHPKQRLNHKFDRNGIFYQMTEHGGLNKPLTDEENILNTPLYFWVFKDKIVFREIEGRRLW